MATELLHTVMPSGGDYTTVNAAIAHLKASHADLVTADKYASVKVDGDWTGVDDTTTVVLDTITTDATRYLRIYTTAAARHDGKWNLGAHRIVKTAARCIYNNYVANIYLDGLQLQTTTPGGTGRGPISSTGGIVVLSNSIVRGDPDEATYLQYGIYPTAGTFYIYNTIIYDISASNYCIVGGGATLLVYSTTGIGGLHGFHRSGGTITAKNCYFGGSASGDYYGTISKVTCASSDATGSAGLQNIAVDTGTFVNVTPGSEDFHLAAGSPLIGVGTDTSGDAAPMNFTTDIDGDAR